MGHINTFKIKEFCFYKIFFLIILLINIDTALGTEGNDKSSPQNHLTLYNLVPSNLSDNLSWVIGRSCHDSPQNEVRILPTCVDLSKDIPYVHNQYSIGSCVGQAITAAMEFTLLKNGAYTPLSPLFVYYNARKLTGQEKQDSGTSLSDGLRSICTWGACKEATWPYNGNQNQFKKCPPPKAYEEAKSFMDLDDLQHSHINYDLTAIKSALANHTPVIFGIYIYSSFEAPLTKITGRIPIPQETETLLGGHAMVFVGYDDEKSEFKILNSYGPQWGDKGFGYLSYDYVLNKGASMKRLYFYPGDLWTINQVGIRSEDTDHEEES